MTFQDFHPIHGYHYIPFWQTTPFKVGASLFAVLFFMSFVYLIYWYFFAPRPVALTADQKALATLEKLVEQSVRTKSEYKQFYYDLTSLIKVYLYDRYGWNVLDKTDQQLPSLLQEHGFNQEHVEKIEELCKRVMFVKYADAQTLAEARNSDVLSARNLIESTRDHDQ